jgi:hypothetical protein
MLAVGNIIGKRKVGRQSKVTAELGGGGSVVVGGSGAGSGGGKRWRTKAAEGI